MRKSLIVAGVAALAFGTTGVALAQNAAPSIDATASGSPTKAGTKSKPKAVKFKLHVVNNPVKNLLGYACGRAGAGRQRRHRDFSPERRRSSCS